VPSKDISVIPRGMYCYEQVDYITGATIADNPIRMCPYWSFRIDKPRQMNGYCSYLESGDWEGEGAGLSLLWDMCKECGVNEGEEED